jgi:hypothetical protein
MRVILENTVAVTSDAKQVTLLLIGGTLQPTLENSTAKVTLNYMKLLTF